MIVETTLIKAQAPTSLAMGYFDGVHRGHTAVIADAVKAAKKLGLIPAVFTLQQSPRTVLLGEESHNINTNSEKLRLLEALGVELVYNIDFRAVRNISADSFLKDIVIDKFCARYLSCGFNFHFGMGARGSGEMLEDMCKSYNISVCARPRINSLGSPVSSTRIRGCISEGKIREANEMLGRYYGIALPVVHGKKLGRTIGIPTLNQVFPQGLVIPRFGAYASIVTVDEKKYCGVTDIGIKPTVGSDKIQIETWMPDYSGKELYGMTIDIRLVDFLREEKKFPSLEELRSEIFKNAEQSKEIFTKEYDKARLC